MRLIIISGRSGSGKTIALRALEDLGFYCIDNLPLTFISQLEQHLGNKHNLVAVSIDARNLSSHLVNFKETIEGLLQEGKTCEILYLDSDEDILLKRFSETRRKHPLTDSKTVLRDAIRKEHTLLTPIASLASLTIDTTHLNPQALQSMVRDRIAQYTPHTTQLLLESFGFKKGLPIDADFIFDIRCLPNPYWHPILQGLTGLDEKVIEFLKAEPKVQQMLDDIWLFLEKWIPSFIADNRSYITIALGCTGGRHRSVYLVERLAEKLKNKMQNCQVRHRDLENLS